MRKIKYTNQFKRDYKKAKARKYGKTIDKDLSLAVELLINDKKLPENICDYALKGDWHDYRDCHIKPDLILIYRKLDSVILELIRLASHSELGF